MNGSHSCQKASNFCLRVILCMGNKQGNILVCTNASSFEICIVTISPCYFGYQLVFKVISKNTQIC